MSKEIEQSLSKIPVVNWLVKLGKQIEKDCTSNHPVFEAARRQNPWFTEANSKQSLSAIASQFLASKFRKIEE